MNKMWQCTGILFLILVLVISCSSQKENHEQDFPNMILLMGDDHGWDEVGYNGHPFVKTPVLDEMAATGLRFDRFYSGHPSCSPTRGSFITGRHPNRYGTFAPNWSIRPEEISVAQLLKKAGYATAHFGKWHLGPVKKESPTSPGAMGFDEWLSHDNFFEIDPVLSRNGLPPQKLEGEGSQILIEEAIKFTERAQEQDKPFFVVVWFGSPHEPYSGLPEDLALYDNLPDSLSEIQVGLTSNETGKRVDRPLRDVLQERYAEITAMDRSIGEMRTFLSEKKIRNNTLVWYCGDNGTPASAARAGMTLRGQKGNMYEGGIRVPGVLEWPVVIEKPTSTKAVAVTTDFLPTLTAIMDIPLPFRPLDGINLLPFFDNSAEHRPSPLYFWSLETNNVFDESSMPYIDPALQEGTTPLVKMMAGKYTRSFRNFHYNEIDENDFSGNRAVMKNQYKLVLQGNDPAGVELFDIESDPGEKNNLASIHPQVVGEMQTEMRTWQESVLNSLRGVDYR